MILAAHIKDCYKHVLRANAQVLPKGPVKSLTLPKIKQYNVIPKAQISAAFPLYLSRESGRKLADPSFRLISLDVYPYTSYIHQNRSTFKSFCDQIFIPCTFRGIIETMIKSVIFYFQISVLVAEVFIFIYLFIYLFTYKDHKLHGLMQFFSICKTY